MQIAAPACVGVTLKTGTYELQWTISDKAGAAVELRGFTNPSADEMQSLGLVSKKALRVSGRGFTVILVGSKRTGPG